MTISVEPVAAVSWDRDDGPPELRFGLEQGPASGSDGGGDGGGFFAFDGEGDGFALGEEIGRDCGDQSRLGLGLFGWLGLGSVCLLLCGFLLGLLQFRFWMIRFGVLWLAFVCGP